MRCCCLGEWSTGCWSGSTQRNDMVQFPRGQSTFHAFNTTIMIEITMCHLCACCFLNNLYEGAVHHGGFTIVILLQKQRPCANIKKNHVPNRCGDESPSVQRAKSRIMKFTLASFQMIESTGVAAIGVHGRTKDERPGQACHDDIIREVVQVGREANSF